MRYRRATQGAVLTAVTIERFRLKGKWSNLIAFPGHIGRDLDGSKIFGADKRRRGLAEIFVAGWYGRVDSRLSGVLWDCSGQVSGQAGPLARLQSARAACALV